jgi:predicted nucleotidyltransferase
MDKGEAINIARKYIELIENRYHIRNALLFGSYAKGTYNEHSDIDIAIVLNNVNDIIDAQMDMMKLRRKIDLRIEPHPFEMNDFNHSNPVADEILKSGIHIDLRKQNSIRI